MPRTLKSEFFRRLTLFCAVIFLVCIAGAGLLLYLFISMDLGPDYGTSFSKMASLRAGLSTVTIYVYLFSFCITVAGIVVVTLIYSHRIAGPAYRIVMEARRVAKGDLSGEMKFREHDAIHPVAVQFNAYLNRYRSKMATLQELLDMLNREVIRANEDMGKDGQQAEELEKIRQAAGSRIRMLRLKVGE